MFVNVFRWLFFVFIWKKCLDMTKNMNTVFLHFEEFCVLSYLLMYLFWEKNTKIVFVWEGRNNAFQNNKNWIFLKYRTNYSHYFSTQQIILFHFHYWEYNKDCLVVWLSFRRKSWSHKAECFIYLLNPFL